MLRRALLAAAALIAAGYAYNGAARAAEAATPLAGHLAAAGLTDAERARIAARLRREGMALAGDVRRKGVVVVAVAVLNGVPWRLVIDPATGDIIGRRALDDSASLPR
jgi:hypothetical protein